MLLNARSTWLREFIVMTLAVPLLLILIPFMPKLVRLRNRVLRWLHWSRAANLLGNQLGRFERDWDLR